MSSGNATFWSPRAPALRAIVKLSKVLQFFTTCCSPPPLPITCETTLRICFSCMESMLEERHSSTGECAEIWSCRSQLHSLEIRRTIARLCTLFLLFHQLGYADCTVSLRVNPFVAPSNGQPLAACYRKYENSKKRAYEQRVYT